MPIRQVLLLVFALASPVLAGPAAFAQQPSQPYFDLPGVKTPEEAEKAKTITCEQTVVHHENHPTHGEEYETMNNCRKGDGPVFQSRNTPLSIERQLRGFNY